MGEIHGVSVFDAGPRGIEPLVEMPYPSSIGILYSFITMHLGFEFNADEYKTMGLAPYGNPSRYEEIFASFFEFGEGSWRMNFLEPETTDFGRETYETTRRKMAELFFPAREEGDPIGQEHCDLAAALQAATDRAMTRLVPYWMKKLSHENLCLAGGVALNCTTNGRILGLKEVRHCFIQPAAGDDGSALGAALQVSHEHGDVPQKMGMPYWGPSSSSDEIEAAFAGAPAGTRRTRHKDLAAAAEAAAEGLAAGRVTAVYQGRMEFGPRALGNRSILADPRDPAMRDRVNAAVKLREAFRPFAPAVLEERLEEVFEASGSLPYMLVAVPVRPAWKDRLPAVTHVDRSARVQTVTAAQNAFLHAVLSAFDRRTGVPVLLNTSFNVKGQPIVHTPREALETFLSTGIDSLFFGNLELSKGGTRASV